MDTLNSQSNILVNNGSGKHLQQRHYKNPHFANTQITELTCAISLHTHFFKILRIVFVYP